MHLMVRDNMLSFIPEVDVRAMRGILKGINLNMEREEEDRARFSSTPAAGSRSWEMALSRNTTRSSWLIPLLC